jgi:hypothetical protein
MPTKRVYRIRVKKVLHYLLNVTVATPQSIIEATGVNPHDIRRMIGDGTLTSSLNYNHNWLIATKELKKRKSHWGFYLHRMKKYSRTGPIFHIKRKARATLSYLASKRPWGITAKEAKQLLGRDCSRALSDLVKINAIQERLVDGEKVFLSRFHKKAEFQIHHRRTNPRFKKDDEEDKDKQEVGVITYEEFCRAFRQTLSEMDDLPKVPEERMSALLLMFTTSRTLRTTETWIRYNPRIREAVDMLWPVDHSTLSRAFDGVGEDFLKELFHKLVIKLYDNDVIKGRFLVVDATHIYAWCNTRKDTSKHPAEGASWGEHHGKFYGYKVHILIDSDSEMPLAMIVSSGEDHDSPHFVPLLEEFEEHYDFDKIIALLADAAYDTWDFRKTVLKKTGGIFLPACNPRKSKILKMMKSMVKTLFDKHGKKIHSVQDAFKYLGQRFLTNFDIDIGTAKESRLVEMVAERLHRPARAAVERVFSRLKSLASFEKPKSKRYSTVIKGLWWCLIGQLVQALAADEKGLPDLMRKRTALV